MTRSPLACAWALALAGCSQSSDGTANRSVWVADGPPVTCISTIQVRTIRVIDDQTVDFETSGRRIYRNNLPLRCSGLTFNRSISHNSRTSQVCSFNTFTVNSPGLGPRGPSCRLGPFQPMTRAPAPVATPDP
jgi:hypothetical protein